MTTRTAGIITKFGTKGYGFIRGDDDESYFVHQKNVFNKTRLEIDTRVDFEVEQTDKGWVALDVQLESGGSSSAPSEPAGPLSDGAIKGLFAVGFVIQAVIIYQVFFNVA